MTAPVWPTSELVELHELFLKVVDSPTVDEKRQLVARIVFHPACRARLRPRRSKDSWQYDAYGC